MRHLSLKLSVISGVAAMTLGTSAVYAVGPGANAHAQSAPTTGGQPSTSGAPTNSGSQAAAGKAMGESRLTDAKLKACQKRETAINNVMKRSIDRDTKIIAVFDKIATRTEAFYVSKGKTLSNYDALVADVATTKTSAEAGLTASQSDSTFSCDSANPKASIMAFKDSIKAEIDALNAYKKAVKNLIVGVKSVQGSTTSSAKSSSSPEPSDTPSPSASPKGVN